ncbi:MAG: polysaccharide deacetylase family protein [Proteobacteria bacterium]|nr:polysaccharide deacetylase family protein [Pseudomonadota bacterium]
MLNAGARRPARLPPNSPPVLLVVIDTEEEFDWTKPFSRESRGVTSIALQPLAHRIFDGFGITPTYVVDYPVATTPAAYSVLRDVHRQGKCEIGAHLQPWVNPPDEEIITTRNSYPGNLPPELERRKLEMLTAAIEANIGTRPRIYKAGRYGVGPVTARILDELGYDIDLSVVPHTSFGEDGGPDFRGWPDQPYWFGTRRRLLEIPLTRGFTGVAAALGPYFYPLVESPIGHNLHIGGIWAHAGFLERITLTPEGIGLADHRRLVHNMLERGYRVFSFTYHSPSLGVGHTPYVRTQDDLDKLLGNMSGFFTFFAEECGGRFMTPNALFRYLATAEEADAA